MSLRSRLQRAIKALTLEEWDHKMDEQELGVPALSGVNVSADAALTFSAFFSAVLQISQTVASLPLPIYRRISDREKERADSHPLFRILNRQVGPYTTSFTWRETMTHHALVWGNGRSLKVRDRAGRLVGFVLLNPARVCLELQEGIPIYIYTSPAGRRIPIPFEDVFQLPGLGFDGLQGYSVVRIARESLGVGLALQEFGARFFGQGTNLGGLITRPKDAPKLTPEAAKRLEQDLKQKWEGLKRSHGVIVLEEGSEFEKIGMPLDDAQFLASKQFSIQDVARWFNMPPHKLKDLSRTTFNNIEQEQLSYTVDTIRPWNVRWETSINTWLLLPSEQDSYHAEHIMDALLRGDIKTRYEGLNTARQNGVINANDWRRMENWNPIPGPAGEAYLVNGNMTPTEKAQGAKNEDPPPPPPPPPPPDNGRRREEDDDDQQLKRQVDRISSRIDALSSQKQPITIGSPKLELHLTVDSGGKMLKKIATMHHADGTDSTVEIEEVLAGGNGNGS